MSSSSLNGQNGGKAHPSLPSRMENKNLGVARQATPDSDALLSSDDDHEPNPSMSMSMHSAKSLPAHRPMRRASWLSEVQSAQRKYSLSGNSIASGGSQPPTPGVESATTWDTAGNQSRPAPWNGQSWQKDRPTRITEVIASPISSAGDDFRSPQNVGAAGLPFEIPLEPNRKTIRSQSYSAGQLDIPPGLAGAPRGGKQKRMPLARRTSRPSILGMESTAEDLGAVEEDDDDGSSIASGQGGRGWGGWHSPQSQQGDIYSIASNLSGTPTQSQNPHRHTASSEYGPMSQSTPSLSDEFAGGPLRASSRGAMASSSTSSGRPGSAQRNDSSRRSQWQTSLTFDIPEEVSQSRRHSFAIESGRQRQASLPSVAGMPALYQTMSHPVHPTYPQMIHSPPPYSESDYQSHTHMSDRASPEASSTYNLVHQPSSSSLGSPTTRYSSNLQDRYPEHHFPGQQPGFGPEGDRQYHLSAGAEDAFANLHLSPQLQHPSSLLEQSQSPGYAHNDHGMCLPFLLIDTSCNTHFIPFPCISNQLDLDLDFDLDLDLSLD
jgi:hypothetical protein